MSSDIRFTNKDETTPSFFQYPEDHLDDKTQERISDVIQKYLFHTKDIPFFTRTTKEIADSIVQQLNTYQKWGQGRSVRIRKNSQIPFTIEISPSTTKLTQLTLYFPERIAKDHKGTIKGGHSFLIPEDESQLGKDYPVTIKRTKISEIKLRRLQMTLEDLISAGVAPKDYMGPSTSEYYSKEGCIKCEIITPRCNGSLKEAAEKGFLSINSRDQTGQRAIKFHDLVGSLAEVFEMLQKIHRKGWSQRSINSSTISLTLQDNGSIKTALHNSNKIDKGLKSKTSNVKELKLFNKNLSQKTPSSPLQDTLAAICVAWEVLFPGASGSIPTQEALFQFLQTEIQKSTLGREFFHDECLKNICRENGRGGFQRHLHKKLSEIEMLPVEDERHIRRLAVKLDALVMICSLLIRVYKSGEGLHELSDKAKKEKNYPLIVSLAKSFKDIQQAFRDDMAEAEFRISLSQIRHSKQSSSERRNTLNKTLVPSVSDLLMSHFDHSKELALKNAELIADYLDCAALQNEGFYTRISRKIKESDVTFALEYSKGQLWLQITDSGYLLGKGAFTKAIAAYTYIFSAKDGTLINNYTSAVKRSITPLRDNSYRNELIESNLSQQQELKKLFSGKDAHFLEHFSLATRVHHYWNKWGNQNCLKIEIEEHRWNGTLKDHIDYGFLPLEMTPNPARKRQRAEELEINNEPIQNVSKKSYNGKKIVLNHADIINDALKRLDLLHQLHAKGYIFGDYSPANMFISLDNKDPHSLKINEIIGDWDTFALIGKIKPYNNAQAYPNWDQFVKVLGLFLPSNDLWGFLETLKWTICPFGRGAFTWQRAHDIAVKDLSESKDFIIRNTEPCDSHILEDPNKFLAWIISTISELKSKLRIQVKEQDWWKVEGQLDSYALNLIGMVVVMHFVKTKQQQIKICFANTKSACEKLNIVFTAENALKMSSEYSQGLTALEFKEELMTAKKNLEMLRLDYLTKQS